MPSAKITTELVSNSITTEFNADALNNFIPYIIPHLIPGDLNSTKMTITTENLTTSITTEC